MERRNKKWEPEVGKLENQRALLYVLGPGDAIILNGTDAVQYEASEVGKDTNEHESLCDILDEQLTSNEPDLWVWEGTIEYTSLDEAPIWNGDIRYARPDDFVWKENKNDED